MNKKNKLIGVLLLSALLLLIFCGMAFGSVPLSLKRIISAIYGHDKNAAVILFSLRLPRVLAAILAGAGLSVAGFLLQTVTDNDLCAPNIIGVNSGAGFFVMLMLCFFPMQWRLQPFAAFAGALLATALVLTLARYGVTYGKKSTVILAGVAISSMLSAAISFLSLKYPDVLSSYLAFSVGGFSGISLEQLAIPAVMIAVAFALSMLLAPKISLLCLGDDAATSCGIQVNTLRTVTVILCSALCAAVVSFAGLLGFVGLIVPHIVRRLIKGSLRRRLPYAVLCGAILTVASDLLGRTLLAPGELPAGIIMAFIGSPFFIWLLIRRRSFYD